MTAQLALQMPPAREAGMKAAGDHAGEAWKHGAYTFLIAFAKSHAVVVGEDVSDAHAAAGHPQPPDLRAWAGLYRRAMRERVLSFLDNDGWSRRRHSPTRRYVSLVAA